LSARATITRRGLIGGLGLLALPRLARAQGFAGLSDSADGFAPVTPGKAFSFPSDHGPHDDFRIEWWYVTANLSDANLKDVNLSRANLVNAKLIGANLRNVVFTNATLLGAQLQGANVNGALWSNTMCPDGTNSNSNGGTCRGHLN